MILIMILIMTRIPPLAAALLALFGLAACQPADPTDPGKLDVVVAFYPLEFAATAIAGEFAAVTNLTQPGTEPHDLELTPRQVGSLANADLVVYLAGFQAQVDEAIAQAAPKRVLDVSTVVAPLTEAEDDGHGHETGAADPHVWLDPTNEERIGAAIADALSEIDPTNAASYESNRQTLTTELTALDREFATGLASCQRDEFVVTHAAFGYLAHRYELHQIGISGLSPDADPSPARIAEIQQIVADTGVTTIFFEPLASSEVAQSIAGDLSLKTAVLDPLEGLTEESAGSNYLEVMRSNLAALEAANDC